MRAVVFDRPGPPDVLHVADAALHRRRRAGRGVPRGSARTLPVQPDGGSDRAAPAARRVVRAGWALHTLVERPAMRRFGAREAPRLFRRSSPPQKGTA